MESDTSKRGLGSVDEKTKEEVARKGGETVSQSREHMAEIGKKGGEPRQEQPTGSRGGSHEQHIKAGEQSPKKVG